VSSLPSLNTPHTRQLRFFTNELEPTSHPRFCPTSKTVQSTRKGGLSRLMSSLPNHTPDVAASTSRYKDALTTTPSGWAYGRIFSILDPFSKNSHVWTPENLFSFLEPFARRHNPWRRGNTARRRGISLAGVCRPT
jgi:hypothetical protein